MANRTYQLWFRETRETMGDRQAIIMAGFAEAHVGSIMDWSVSPLLPTPSASGMGIDDLVPTPLQHMPAGELFPELIQAGSGADSYLRSDWPMPSSRNSGIALYRRTNLPASKPWNEVHAVVGILAWPGAAVDFTKIHVFEAKGADQPARFAGHLGHEVRPDFEVPDMVEATRGNPVGNVLELPVWGFGDEALSYRQRFISEHLLDAMAFATKEVASGSSIEDLPKDVTDLLRPQRLLPDRDPQYISFLRELYNGRPDILEDRYRPLNAREVLDREEAGRMAVRRSLEADEADQAPGM